MVFVLRNCDRHRMTPDTGLCQPLECDCHFLSHGICQIITEQSLQRDKVLRRGAHFRPHLVKDCSVTKSSNEGCILGHIWLKSAAWQSPPMRGTFLDHIWLKPAVWQSLPTRGIFWTCMIEVRCVTDSSYKGRWIFCCIWPIVHCVTILFPTRNYCLSAILAQYFLIDLQRVSFILFNCTYNTMKLDPLLYHHNEAWVIFLGECASHLHQSSVLCCGKRHSHLYLRYLLTSTLPTFKTIILSLASKRLKINWSFKAIISINLLKMVLNKWLPEASSCEDMTALFYASMSSTRHK